MKTKKILILISILISTLNINAEIDEFDTTLWLGNYKEIDTIGYEFILSNKDSILILQDSVIMYSFYIKKDTFIEISDNYWYNEATGEVRDSTLWYYNIEQFVKLLEEYERKCYNDSIEDCRYRNICEGKTTYGWRKCWSEYTCIWEHQTPTLSGLKIYLKSKLKK